MNLNVTIPTSDYSESIWDDWFVISFTAKTAKSFKPFSLLSEGRDEGGWVLYVSRVKLNVTIPTYTYSDSIWGD